MEGKQEILLSNLSGLLRYLASVSKVKSLMRFMEILLKSPCNMIHAQYFNTLTALN